MEAGVDGGLNSADVDGDGDLEIIAAARDGRLYVWRGDGTLLPGWPFQSGSYFNSSPAVGDLDGDGACEVVASSNDGNLYALSAHGVVLAGWPKALDRYWPHSGGSLTQCSPVLVDVDRDGSLDIVHNGSLTKRTHVFDRFGRDLPGWPQPYGTDEFTFTSPIAVDLDGDGSTEVVAGVMFTMSPPNHNKLYAWHADGALVAGWPVTLETYWYSPFWSIAAADVDGDGKPEVVASDPLRAYVLDGTGRMLPGWPVELDFDLGGHYLALGDLDTDGRVEVVIASTLTDKLRVLDDDGDALLSMSVASIASPALADVDGDGEIDIVAGRDYPLHSLLVIRLDGGIVDLPMPTQGYVHGLPMVLDLDADGRVEVAAADRGRDANRLHVFVWDLPSRFDAGTAPWSMYQHDAAHTGWLTPRVVRTHVEAPRPPAPTPATPVAGWALASPRPNPFRGHATFEFDVPRAARVRLEVHDLNGRRVKTIEDGTLSAGRYSRGWDGSDTVGAPAPGGIYFAHLRSEGVLLSRKAILVR